MNLENFMVSERSQTQKSYVLFYLFVFGYSGSLFAAPRFFSSRGEWGLLSSCHARGFSLWWLLLLRSMVRGEQTSVVVVHGLSWPMGCGIFADQG